MEGSAARGGGSSADPNLLPWRGWCGASRDGVRGACSWVCPVLLATALQQPAQPWQMLLSLAGFCRWRQDQGEACTDCCPEPERVHIPSRKPSGAQAESKLWHECGRRQAGLCWATPWASGLRLGVRALCSPLLKHWGGDCFGDIHKGPFWRWKLCLARAVLAFAGTERKILKASKQTKSHNG